MKSIKNIMNKIAYKSFYYIVIAIFALIACISMFNSKFNILFDDGIQHVYRVIGTANSIKENGIFSKIISEFCNGFGYGWNIFYSPFTSIVPLIFRLITNSYIMCLKLFTFMLMLFSGIFMYKLVLKISNSKKAALLSALLYMLAPYHLTDMFSRIAIAESASFAFLPMVFIGLYDILEKREKQNYYLILGASGLLLTHNVITLYTAIFCAIYCLINLPKLKDKFTLKSLVISILLILLITSFYWLPLLQHYFGAEYEVFKPNRMYNNNTIINEKLSLIQLIYEQKVSYILYVGIPILIGTLAFILTTRTKNYSKTLLTFLIFGIVSIIMSSKYFPFEYLPSPLKMLQFPWRMTEFATFFLSIVAGIGILRIWENKKYILGVCICFVIIGFTIYYVAKNAGNYVKEDINEIGFYTPVRLTPQSKRVHAGCASFEYLPVKAYENYEHLMNRDSNILIVEGNAEISEFVKESGLGKANIINARS